MEITAWIKRLKKEEDWKKKGHLPMTKLLSNSTEDWLDSLDDHILEFYGYLLMTVSINLKQIRIDDAMEILGSEYMVEESFHNRPDPGDIDWDGPKNLKAKAKDEGIPDMSKLDDESIRVCHKLLDVCKREKNTPANLIQKYVTMKTVKLGGV